MRNRRTAAANSAPHVGRAMRGRTARAAASHRATSCVEAAITTRHRARQSRTVVGQREGDRNKFDHAINGGGVAEEGRRPTCVILNGSGIQLAVGPTTIVTPKSLFRIAHRIMVKRLATSPHDPLGITDSVCKNQLVMVSVKYGPFNTYIPIRSTTIGKSRVARDPIAMHTS
ncbi:phosphoenolpyruvate carboxylase 4 [Dorcoceras hygrometricum]|uniref:Phosphoenolpyruvate carboxylase 4 n=1 Tax=Dorcoceras hygrometricum TaxID=472368 RepID=A0A2Z7BR62_9LAMI|nr:phosphoenolpyruvate carboxylase 4 [Dorcoceras hygrometricum]